MTLVVADLGWVDFDSDVPSSCPAAQPVLPNPHWPQQNRADIGTSKYKSTQPMSVTTSDTLYRLLHGTENLPVDRQIHIYRILPHFYMNECHEHGKRGMTSNGVCFGRVRENGFGSSAQFHRPKTTNMQNISRRCEANIAHASKTNIEHSA